VSDRHDPKQPPDTTGRLGWVLAAVGCSGALVAALLSPVHARSAAAQDWSPFVLVLSRVNHCDLRDSQGLAVVGPPEWRGPAVVIVDEGDDLVGQVIDRVELTTT